MTRRRARGANHISVFTINYVNYGAGSGEPAAAANLRVELARRRASVHDGRCRVASSNASDALPYRFSARWTMPMLYDPAAVSPANRNSRFARSFRLPAAYASARLFRADARAGSAPSAA